MYKFALVFNRVRLFVESLDPIEEGEFVSVYHESGLWLDTFRVVEALGGPVEGPGKIGLSDYNGTFIVNRENPTHGSPIRAFKIASRLDPAPGCRIQGDQFVEA